MVFVSGEDEAPVAKLPPALGKKTPVKANGNLLFLVNHSRFVCKN